MDVFCQDAPPAVESSGSRGLRMSCGSDVPALEPVAEESSAARLSVDITAVAPVEAAPLAPVAAGPLAGRVRSPGGVEQGPRALLKSSSVKLSGSTPTRLTGQRKTLDSAEAAELKRLKSVRFSTASDSDTDDGGGSGDLPAFPGTKKSLARKSLTLEPGETWQKLSQFTALKEIYRGRVSLVAAGTCKASGRAVVLKAYIKSKLTKSLHEMVYREVRLHGRCNGIPGVVGLLGWWEDDAQIVLIQEHCAGGDLYRELVLNGGQMSEAAAVQEILCPLMLVLSAVHRLGLAHRDLKPENLFFSTRGKGERQLRVGDFGLASDLKEMRDRVGTLDYMAPEVITQKDESNFRVTEGDGAEAGELQLPSCKGYTNKVDVWALGAIAYELLVGKPPFEVADPQKTAMLIVWGQLRLPDTLSPGAEAFIRAALTKDPELRPDVDTLLQSPWITSLRVPTNAAGTWLADRATFPSVLQLESGLLATKSVDLSAVKQLDFISASETAGKRKLPPSKSKSTRILSRKASPPPEGRPMPAAGRKSGFTRRARGSYDSNGGDSDSEPGSFRSFRKPMARQRRRSSRFSADSNNSDEEGSKSRGSVTHGGRLHGASNLRRASDASTEDPQAAAMRSTGSGGTASRSSSSSSQPLLRRLSSFLGLGACMSPKAMGEEGAASGELSSAAPGTPRVKREPPRPSTSEASACTISAEKVRSSRGVSDGSACSVVTSASERSGAKQRRPISRAASRIGLGVSRLVSRFFDDAPWNTGGAALRSFASLARPEDEELERIQTESANVMRNRFMEYMMRRGGNSAELSRTDDLGRLETSSSGGGGGGAGAGAPATRPSEGRRRAAPRPSATFSNLCHVPVEVSQPAMTLTSRPAVLADFENLSLRGQKSQPA